MTRRPSKAKLRPKAIKYPGAKPVGGWDVQRMVALCGGPEALRESHAAFGFKRLTPSQVSNWRSRYSVPSGRLAEFLITLRSVLGDKFNAMDFVQVKTAK